MDPAGFAPGDTSGVLNPFWDQTVDGNPDVMGFDPNGIVNPIDPVEPQIIFRGRGAGHPFTGQPFANEIAAFSWNFMSLLIAQSDEYRDLIIPNDPINDPDGENQGFRAPLAFAVMDPANPGVPICSFITPQHCGLVTTLFGVAGLTRNDVRAGGNAQFGRRTMAWQSGGEILLRFEKRNVLGFGMDFAEDFTKTNWGLESTWIEGTPVGDTSRVNNTVNTDTFNVTISMDRPTFINFLNANRTFFITSQWFFSYRTNYSKSQGNGPFRVGGILAVQTGYFQDRLLPSMLFVYDVQSASGAALPQVTYRFNENFSATVGLAFFMGRTELFDMSINPIGPTSNQIGPHAYQNGVETGLALVRDRDEIFFRLRYTF